MRLSIQHQNDTRGFLSKTTLYKVEVTVEFTPEERSTIDSLKLSDHILVPRAMSVYLQNKGLEPIPEKDALRVRQLLKGMNAWSFDTLGQAQTYEQDVTDALKALKGVIENKDAYSKPKVVEI